jgi:integrase
MRQATDRVCGGKATWSSPPRSARRSSPATCCGGSRYSLRGPGLRGVHLHTLWHSTASFLLAAGTHTKVVQEHLGHSSYAITADIYSHVAPEQKREAADRLDAALNW